MKFQDKLKELRTKHNETQQDLADFLNITFQSVSKWEKGVCLPNIELIKEIATHYGVTLDSLLIDNIKLEKADANNNEQKRQYHPTFNKDSFFSVYTEGHFRSYYVEGTYRTAIPKIQSAASHKANYVLAIDASGKIIYMGYGTGYGYGSPCDQFYHQKEMIEVRSLECFHLLESYTPYGDGTMHHNDFEFLIPKGGFVITIADNSFEFKSMLDLFLNGKFNNWFNISMIKAGSLDRFTFTINEDTLTLSYTDLEKDVFKNSITSDLFKDLFHEYLKTHKREIIEQIKESIEIDIEEVRQMAEDAMNVAEDAMNLAEDALNNN